MTFHNNPNILTRMKRDTLRVYALRSRVQAYLNGPYVLGLESVNSGAVVTAERQRSGSGRFPPDGHGFRQNGCQSLRPAKDGAHASVCLPSVRPLTVA